MRRSHEGSSGRLRRVEPQAIGAGPRRRLRGRRRLGCACVAVVACGQWLGSSKCVKRLCVR
jgi:hypothetical protein